MSFISLSLLADTSSWSAVLLEVGFRTAVLQDPKVQAYLASLDLDLSEGQALYRLLQNGALTEGKCLEEGLCAILQTCQCK